METGIKGNLVCISTIHPPLYPNIEEDTIRNGGLKPTICQKPAYLMGYSGDLWEICMNYLPKWLTGKDHSQKNVF